MKKLLAASFAACSLMAAGSVSAAPLSLELQNGNFGPAIAPYSNTLTGSFKYDSSLTGAAAYSGWSITSNASALSSAPGQPAPYTYTPANSTVLATSTPGVLRIRHVYGAGIARTLVLVFSSSLSTLTKAGDFVDLAYDDFDPIMGSYDSYTQSSPSVAQYAGVQAGGRVAVTPIPAAAWLFGTGIMGLVGAAKRKKAKAAA